LFSSTAFALRRAQTQILWSLEITGTVVSKGEIEDAMRPLHLSHIPLWNRSWARFGVDPIAFQADIKRIEHFIVAWLLSD